LADALTAIAALSAELNPLTDLAVESWNITNKSLASTFAGEANSNIDTGATFALLGADGYQKSFKMPGFPLYKVGPGGVIDPEDEDVVAFFALFKSEGGWTLDDGEVITGVVSGMLDK